MSPRQKRFTHRTGAFTLIELLVVVAIIALLISILLPSMKDAREQARAVVCQNNTRQLVLALFSYKEDNRGSYPDTLWSEWAWWTHKSDLWFYKLNPKYHGEPKGLICPSDPYGSQFDFDAKDEQGRLHWNYRVASCGYGLSYLLRNNVDNIDGKMGPKWLDRTILLAEVGPDNDLRPGDLGQYYVNGPTGGSTATVAAMPWRDGGRLLWDDAKSRGWFDGPTWLTARHRGYIHVAAMDGAVKRARTREMMKQRILGMYRGQADGIGGKYPDCYGRSTASGRVTYVCPLCHSSASDMTHYSFARDNLWWWTGATGIFKE